MTEPATCPVCGRPIPEGAPVVGGSAGCPHCLLGAGIPTGAVPGAGGASGAVASSIPADPPSPEGVQARFPDYEILGLLGRGGMGVVWKARNKALDRVVALKVLPAQAAAQPGFSDRFQREARALARLEHPNIVGVHEFGVRDGTFFLVMEYVDGVDMRHALRAGRIGPREALQVVPQICDALQYAHDHGVVHRDIKPENVLIDVAGRVKVADFGLAKIVAGDASPQDLTVTGQVMGTPHYMAPEQFEKPTTVDHRADIYSLGVVFYEMLTGELPLGRFPPPSEKFQVDVRFDEVVLRSLQKQPELRWQHASDVKSEVGVIASTPRAAAAAPPRVPRPAADARLSSLAVIGGLGTPAALAVALLVALAAALAGKQVSSPVFVVTFAIVAAAAWTVSVAALVGIQRSRGALRGKGWAVTGTVLPLVALCAGLPLVIWRSALKETVVQPGPTIRIFPPEPLQEQASVRAQVAELLVRLTAAGPSRTIANVGELYDDEARTQLTEILTQSVQPLGDGGAFGLPLISDAILGVPIGEFRLEVVDVALTGGAARVTIARGARRATFGVKQARDGRWRFAAEPVLVTGAVGDAPPAPKPVPPGPAPRAATPEELAQLMKFIVPVPPPLVDPVPPVHDPRRKPTRAMPDTSEIPAVVARLLDAPRVSPMSEVLAHYDGDARRAIRATWEADLHAEPDGRTHGFPLFLRQMKDEPVPKFEVRQICVFGATYQAWVTAVAGTSAVSFWMTGDDGQWLFDDAPVDVRTLQPSDPLARTRAVGTIHYGAERR